MMGKGVAIEPSDGTIYAPADGEITVAYQTKHAYGLTTDDGVEILIHIGLDTVNLEGQGFESFVTQGQKVKKGDKLGTFDTNTIKKAGYPVTTMVIITNTKAFNDVAVDEAFDNGIQAGHQIITAIPKTSDSAVGAPA